MSSYLLSRGVVLAASLIVAGSELTSVGRAQQIPPASEQKKIAISPQCASIRNMAAQTACEVQRIRAEDLAAHRAHNAATTQSANNEGTCADEVKAGIQAGQFTREKLSTILAGRPAREVGPCNILAQLKQ